MASQYFHFVLVSSQSLGNFVFLIVEEGQEEPRVQILIVVVVMVVMMIEMVVMFVIVVERQEEPKVQPLVLIVQ